MGGNCASGLSVAEGVGTEAGVAGSENMSMLSELGSIDCLGVDSVCAKSSVGWGVGCADKGCSCACCVVSGWSFPDIAVAVDLVSPSGVTLP